MLVTCRDDSLHAFNGLLCTGDAKGIISILMYPRASVKKSGRDPLLRAFQIT